MEQGRTCGEEQEGVRNLVGLRIWILDAAALMQSIQEGLGRGRGGGRNGRETRDNKKDARDDWEEIRFLRCE